MKEAMVLTGAAVLLTAAGACSAASAVGCVTGVASGVALGGIAASGSSDDPEREVEIDTGAAMLGGAIFGAVSGCTAAAVADAMARGDARHKPAAEAPERARGQWHGPTPRRASASKVDPGIVTANAHFHGISVSWRGQPQVASESVELRFQRYVKRGENGNCEQVELELDGERLGLPTKYSEATGGSIVLETFRASASIQLLRRIQKAKRVALRLCETEHRLSLPALEANRRFLVRFERLAPPRARSDKPGSESEPESEPEAEVDADAGVEQPPAPTSPSDANVDAATPGSPVVPPHESPSQGPAN